MTTSWGSSGSLTVDANAILTAPVLDPTSRNIFVGDSTGVFSYVREVGSTAGTCKSGTTLPCLGNTTITGLGNITDPPIVDPSTEKVFVFSGQLAEVLQADVQLGSQKVATVGHT